MQIHKLDFTAANGVPFRAVFLPDGMSVARPAANKYNKTLQPRVEFFDRRYDHTLDGQFIADYYVDTLLGLDGYSRLPVDGTGLDLQGDVKDWKIDGDAMDVIRTWIRTLTDRSD